MLTVLDVVTAMRKAGIPVQQAGGGLPCSITGVSTDSRSIQAGDLYVALRGERFDGNAFAAAAAAQGASCVLVEHEIPGLDVTQLIVPDGLHALGALAAWWRSRLEVRIIGVCGSNGKTTTTQMIAGILAQAHRPGAWFATQGNRNNEVGVPQMLLALRPKHRIAVIEMGMNHVGEISRLAAMVRPDVLVITNAQREHQEFLESVEQTARENGAAIGHMPAAGVVVIPADDACAPIWRELAGARRVHDHGWQSAARVMGKAIPAEDAQHVLVESGQTHLEFTLHAAGLHFARNALAAAAAGLAAGLAPDAITAALSAFRPVGGRGTRHRLPGGACLIDDSYNANPDSVLAAIDALAAESGWRVLVLGDMGEVGTRGPAFHTEVGAYARARGIHALLCLGEATRASVDAFGAGAVHCDDHDEVGRRLRQALLRTPAGGGSTVAMVKGSRFMKMEKTFASWIDAALRGNVDDGGVDA